MLLVLLKEIKKIKVKTCLLKNKTKIGTKINFQMKPNSKYTIIVVIITMKIHPIYSLQMYFKLMKLHPIHKQILCQKILAESKFIKLVQINKIFVRIIFSI